jgi:hypothetical protein
MATTTPNFGWPVPTSTDLVKDGATAIEALGDGIDTSMVDLKGGLTGQVLAKATNADMDFSWVAQDDSNAIQNSIINAKGDLIAGSADDTPAILSIGADNLILTAASGAATGLSWSGASTSFTPTLTNITLGNGTSTASYVRVGNLICLTGKITLGSTTTIAAGAKISLPVNAKLAKVQSASVHYQDTGTNDIVGFFLIDAVSTARFYVIDASATYSVYQGISATIPFTWASTDEIIYNLVYEVA